MVVPQSKERRCHVDEKAALLQFKHSFASTNQCYNDWSYVHPKPKLESWKEGCDCCSWEGVECDDRTDHVIGLDLSGSCLFGSINSSSNALFTLTHLQRLNLSYNDFNYSHIPSAIGNLSRLTHLDLSASYLTGQIPQQQLSNITTLVSLDLSYNYRRDDVSAHGLEVHSVEGLVQHMINLKELHLLDVIISSSHVPQLLSNFSSLESLLLRNCELKGEFPVAIFHLPKLKMLDLSDNHDLRGYLPDFPSGSPLKSLLLYYTSFGGVVPPSIGNLASLEDIDISSCNFTGKLPMSLGNLTQLVSFNLWGDTFYHPYGVYFTPDSNRFSPDSFTTTSLSWIGKLTKLTHLNLARLDLTGGIPSWLMNLTQIIKIDMTWDRIPLGLQVLNLSRNRLSGHISSSFSNMENLESLDLSQNQLTGSIPVELTKLTSLSSFDVSYNNLSGPIPQGNQFCTFELKSFEGNVGLFFEPWNKLCGNARSLPQLQQPPSHSEEEGDDSESDLKIEWMIISIGFVSGLVVGVILGNELIARKQYWFVKTLARIGIR
ncbi:unnamed protein product [Cuscuta campestris]|uniref:Leucine-rich repeat-containing N-terminal plant-type domain-containing protein n=1 Tax=Cuscuta campestris TaxID=132261 RepID=A0A484LAT7_9ASTE|nr:unnamed protein product [Cuscuta campestris]